MRVVVAALLALSACAADPTPPTRDVGDFCSVPSDACGKRLVDDQGNVHVVVCPGGAGPLPSVNPALPVCTEGANIRHGEEGDVCQCRHQPRPNGPLVWVCPD